MVNEAEQKVLEKLAKPSGSKLDRYRVLQLNADFRPLYYCPLSTFNWQQTMFLLVKGMTTGVPRLQILEYYDDVYVRTAHDQIQLPSVVAHLEYIPPPAEAKFTKFNIFLRDEFRCQYTGEKHPPKDLTFDHVIPRSRGGKTTWDNIVTAYRPINEMKDDKTPKEAGLQLLKKPHRPTYHELLNKGRKYPPKYLHESWEDYLYWDTELEP